MPIGIFDPDTPNQRYIDAADGQVTMALPVAGLRTECIEVWLNGIKQSLGIGWTRSGESVRFAEPLVGTDIVRIVWSTP